MKSSFIVVVKSLAPIAAIGILQIATSSAAIAEEWRCAFLMETQRGGQSFSATCSPNPEVFGGRDSEYCNNPSNDSLEQIQNVSIDLEQGTVSWMEVSRLSPHGIERMTSRYIRDGETEEAANARASRVFEFESEFDIYETVRAPSLSRFDPITEERLDPYREFVVTTISFGSGYGVYQIVLSDLNDHAVLIQPVFEGRNSWVDIRHGRCGRE